MAISNPWHELILFNLFGLIVVLLWMFGGAWWDKRRGVEPISKRVWLTLVALLCVPANVFAVIAILRTS
jgi:hypothetical protein